ncbi:MAG TPA: TolC family protein [Rhodocyclaceae bacterium]|jgi:outer membrane protein TolC|nr:TolC family protein [Rhodocyclaceae bacterium]
MPALKFSRALVLCAPLACLLPLSLVQSAQAAPPAGSAMGLNELLDQLRQNNPQIEQAQQQQIAAQAVVPQVTAWDNPIVGLVQGPMQSSPFRFGASQAFSYTLTQPFKLFGKKRLAGEIAQSQADVAGAQITFTRQQLEAQLKTTFYQLLAYQDQERISQDNLQRLEQIKRISKVRYANNAAAYTDYLNAQVAQSSAQNDLFALEKQVDTTRQTLNMLIGRNPGQPLTIKGDLPSDAARVPDLDELTTLTLQRNPALQGSASQVTAAEKNLEYAKKAYLPDFQVIFTRYSDNPPWGFYGNNYGLELDVTLPTWFLTKERAGEDQAQAGVIAQRANDTSVRQQVLLGVATAWNSLQQARKQLDFIHAHQLPEAQVAWRLAMQNYATSNNQAFADLLMAQTNLHNTELAQLQAQSAAAQAWAALEAAVGSKIE